MLNAIDSSRTHYAHEDNPHVQLSVQNVIKDFDIGRGESLRAVDDVSFDVPKNEMCVILGPSGCGKSTVLRMIAGLEEMTSGSIYLNDEELDGPGRDRGMVFQGYTSFPWLTIRDNVEYGMRLNGVSKKVCHERADEYLELVHLTKFKDAYPDQLSGGMKQRVAIARTLANEPSILLMDEPFGALDAETRWHMQELLMGVIVNSQTTALMITHDISEAIYLADRIIFMSSHPGRVREILVPEFKQGKRILNKEEVIGCDGFVEMEAHIMQMMREESADDDDAF